MSESIDSLGIMRHLTVIGCGRVPGRRFRNLMRLHKKTIRGLAKEMGLTQKRVREIRQHGTADAATARDWTQAITGTDPGCHAAAWIGENYDRLDG